MIAAWQGNRPGMKMAWPSSDPDDEGAGMPLFDFHCASCDTTVELMVKADARPACPKCGAAEMEKQIPMIAPHLRSPGMKKAMRAAAKKEGHMSNF
jgi:putative FmdB family regulatory protein